MNRLEKIRQLPDKELINFLIKISNNSMCGRCKYKNACNAHTNCNEGITKYFKEEGDL